MISFGAEIVTTQYMPIFKVKGQIYHKAGSLLLLPDDEVAIVTVGDQFEPRDIVLHRRNDQLVKIAETHRCYDALRYPIIFWDGADGYHINIKICMQKRLIFIRLNQTKLRSEEYIHLRDAVVNDGSPRHMHEYAQDAIAYVRQYGRPDQFMTFTCNPAWDDIQNLLLPGQSTMDRHDITARVFRQKLK
ncbi:unnamed protein product [Onchocerca ochengi]|uniref:Helitron_like_N domain-containing protein n=1 Tax=Onchocerca ochengi TaxID=42157 RepID=A0A182EG63_ONCOC|nr:unnamed protein product [Onchocerca ochengi]